MAAKKKQSRPPVAEFRADYRTKEPSPLTGNTPPPPDETELSYTADYRGDGEQASLSPAPVSSIAEEERNPFPFEAENTSRLEDIFPSPPDADFSSSGEAIPSPADADSWEENLFGEVSPPPSKEEKEIPELSLAELRRVRPRGKHRYGVAVGSLVLLLALVGAVFLAVTAGQAIHRASAGDSGLRAYDTWLAPIVMQDPAPFDSIGLADPDMVMTASLWSAVSLAGPEAFNSYDDQGRTLVPLAEVESAAKALFGPDCVLQARTPEEETFFVYDSETSQFHVSPFSSQSAYQPYTESVSQSDGSEILRVGYVSPADDFYAAESAAAAPTPVKYMEYVLKTDPASGEKFVFAIHMAK